MRTAYLLFAALCIGQTAVAAPDFYLKGYENDWGAREELKFSENNGVYSLHVDKLDQTSFPYGFKIADANWNSQYGTRADFAFDTAMSCVAGDGNNFSLPSSVKSVAGATFTFDYRNTSSPTLTVAPDLYLAGEVTGWSNTRPEYRFSEQDGVYTLELDRLSGPFRIAAGITDAWLVEFGGQKNMEAGKTYDCTTGAGNDMTLSGGALDKVVLTFNKASKRLKVTSLTPQALSGGLYLAGAMNSWHSDNAAYRFTESNGTYELNVAGLTGEFKIVTPDWGVQFGGNGSIELDKAYGCVLADNGSNMKLASATPVDATIKFNLASKSVTVARTQTAEANPDFYLCGLNGDWGISDNLKFNVSGGVYTLHVDNLTQASFPSGFKIASAGWKSQYGTKAAPAIGQAMACVPGDGNNFTLPASVTSLAGATFVVDYRNPSAPTLTIEPDLYLAGEINSWSNTNANYRFNRQGDVYTLSLGELSGSFRIAAGAAPDWLVEFGGQKNMSAGNTYSCIAGKGNDMTLSGGTLRNVTLEFDKNALTLKISGGSADKPVTGGTAYYLAGAVNNWASDNQAYRFTESGGRYTLSLSRLAGEFKIVTADWSQQFGCASKLSYGQVYSCVMADYGYNMQLADSEGTNVVITFDPANRSVEVKGMPTLYLTGDFNNWAIQNLYAFTYADGTYTLTTHDFSGRFKIVNDDWNIQFGTNGSDAFGTDRAYPLSSAAGSDGDISFWGAGGSRLKLTLKTNDRAVSKVMADIMPDETVVPAEDAPVEYYNLQGVRVNCPSHGIYIRRCGTKVEKIAVK